MELFSFRCCGLLFAALALLTDITSGAAAAELSCETRTYSAKPGEGTERLRRLRCAPGELLMAGDMVLSNGTPQCNTAITSKDGGRAQLDGNCGHGTYGVWTARLSCCRVSPAAGALSCSSQRHLAGRDKPVPPAWEKICCERGALATAQVYLYQTGRGNCPVRTVDDAGASCASVAGCGEPEESNEWVLDMVCCASEALKR